MWNHRRNLPHRYPPGTTLFLTWRLFGSLPHRVAPAPEIADQNAGKVFLVQDRELDRAAVGPLWLKNRRVAQLMAEALQKGAGDYRLYELFAWVVMPNHVHVVWKPFRPLPEITRWIKGSTARAANLLLGRTGKPFWQYESYDHCIRNDAGLNRVIRYVEQNPVGCRVGGGSRRLALVKRSDSQANGLFRRVGLWPASRVFKPAFCVGG